MRWSGHHTLSIELSFPKVEEQRCLQAGFQFIEHGHGRTHDVASEFLVFHGRIFTTDDPERQSRNQRI